VILQTHPHAQTHTHTHTERESERERDSERERERSEGFGGCTISRSGDKVESQSAAFCGTRFPR